jgi:rhamnulose-1-phosphate aldolase
MSSILEGRPALKKEVDKIAEVVGYLWQNGWAERNGDNITVNITDLVDDGIKSMPAISEVKQIGTALPAFQVGCSKFDTIFCTILDSKYELIH